MTVGRHAWQSASGNARTQGVEHWQGTRIGPQTPRNIPAWALAVASPHLWRRKLSADLAEGAHVAEVTATDPDGRAWRDRIVFEIRAERPPRFWRQGALGRGPGLSTAEEGVCARRGRFPAGISSRSSCCRIPRCPVVRRRAGTGR